jgi:hypothetical protein
VSNDAEARDTQEDRLRAILTQHGSVAGIYAPFSGLVDMAEQWVLYAQERDELAHIERVGKSAAYSERNVVVAFAALLANSYRDVLAPVRSWLGIDPNESEGWRHVVYISIETGAGKLQFSWHIPDSDLPLVQWLSPGDEPWDGHTTEEKYARLRELLTTF